MCIHSKLIFNTSNNSEGQIYSSIRLQKIKFGYDKIINMSSRQGLLHTLRKLDLRKLSLSSGTFVRHPLNMMAVYDMVSTSYIFL